MRWARVVVGTRALEAHGVVMDLWEDSRGATAGKIVAITGAGAGSRHQSLVVGERVPVQMLHLMAQVRSDLIFYNGRSELTSYPPKINKKTSKTIAHCVMQKSDQI
jgi:hypothetical protein